MTQNEKDLLVKDLSARLPYGVKVQTFRRHSEEDPTIIGYPYTLDFIMMSIMFKDNIEEYKPYLFPLSSMTEEQKNECFKGTPLEIDKYGDIVVKDNLYGGSQYTDLEIYLEVINWLLKNHFDIYGLIPMGLAIDATNKNIY